MRCGRVQVGPQAASGAGIGKRRHLHTHLDRVKGIRPLTVEPFPRVRARIREALAAIGAEAGK